MGSQDIISTPLDALLYKTENDHFYHVGIVNALEYAVKFGSEKVSIVSHKQGKTNYHVWLTKEDWSLAFAKCENYFNAISDNEKVKVLSELKRRII